jgi:hypothetical protein
MFVNCTLKGTCLMLVCRMLDVLWILLHLVTGQNIQVCFWNFSPIIFIILRLTRNNYCELFLAPTNYTGHAAVAQFVEALRYKPECRGFNCSWCHWNFSFTLSFWPHYASGVDSASNRNEYQEYFLSNKGGRCIWLTTLSLSCSDCHEI